jgi:hypothetical protein
MSGAHVTRTAAILERIALSLRGQVTTLRRCLCCDAWMHSTGSDHRLCNPCKGEPDYTGSLVGKRVNVRGRRKGMTE